MSPAGRALPVVDRDSAPFWEALRRHELTVQRCTACGRHRFPPRVICARCHSFDSEWVACAPSGRLLSWAHTYQNFHPRFPAVPYTVVLVQFDGDDGLAMYGDLVGDADGLTVGVAMQAVFEDVTDDVTLVHWEVAK